MNIYKLQQESLQIGLSANPNVTANYETAYADGFNAAKKLFQVEATWREAGSDLVCSRCESRIPADAKSNFCPYCGASMQEGGRVF